MAKATRARILTLLILSILKSATGYPDGRTPEVYPAKPPPLKATSFADAANEVQEQAKFFQDFFSVQLSPHKLEFGHVCEDPHNWEQRYESKDYKNNRDMGKVRWGDKNGGYGEHYWDFNHAGRNGDDSQNEATENDYEYEEADDENPDEEEEYEDDDEEENEQQNEKEQEAPKPKTENKQEVNQPIYSSQMAKQVSKLTEAYLDPALPENQHNVYQNVKNAKQIQEQMINQREKFEQAISPREKFNESMKLRKIKSNYESSDELGRDAKNNHEILQQQKHEDVVKENSPPLTNYQSKNEYLQTPRLATLKQIHDEAETLWDKVKQPPKSFDSSQLSESDFVHIDFKNMKALPQLSNYEYNDDAFFQHHDPKHNFPFFQDTHQPFSNIQPNHQEKSQQIIHSDKPAFDFHPKSNDEHRINRHRPNKNHPKHNANVGERIDPLVQPLQPVPFTILQPNIYFDRLTGQIMDSRTGKPYDFSSLS